MRRIIELPDHFPKIVCLCGSRKFANAFAKVNRELSFKGYIVLSWTTAVATTDDRDLDPLTESQLQNLQLRKLELSDELFIINVNGYIGKHTRWKIEYAKQLRKPIKYLVNWYEDLKTINPIKITLDRDGYELY